MRGSARDSTRSRCSRSLQQDPGPDPAPSLPAMTWPHAHVRSVIAAGVYTPSAMTERRPARVECWTLPLHCQGNRVGCEPSSMRSASSRQIRSAMASGPPCALSSCSQNRTTAKPSRCRARCTSDARKTLPSILRFQYPRLAVGRRRLQDGHRCQKQPSTKTATRRSSKTTSGLPGSSVAWSRQPRTLERMSEERSLHSVERFPWERTMPMRALRSALLRKSLEGKTLELR